MVKAFVAPFILYLLGTNLLARFDERWYPLGYAIVAAIVAGASWWLLRGTQIIRPHRHVRSGIIVGIVGIALWIFLSQLQLERALENILPAWLLPGPRVGFNPFAELSAGWPVWSFIAIRLIGIAVIVPLAEELFWRGFLLRWFIDPEWEKVPIGEYSFSSCLLVSILFALAHPEWLAAFIYALLLNGLLYWKRDLWLCMVAHGVSNLLLALYVMRTGQWWLW